MNNYRRYLWHKRYVVIYIDKIRSINNYGIPQESDNEQAEEFNDKSACDNLIEELKVCNLRYIVIDRERKKILINTITPNNYQTTDFNYKLLEHYIGENKSLEDFVDNKKKELYELATNNNRYAPDYRFEAMIKYNKYLNETWGRNKSRKDLPKLQVYDDPHMVKEEIDALKKEEKDKLKLITEKCGW